LAGKNIPIPWDRNIPLMVKHISLETEDRDVLIKSAELVLKDMNIEAKGKVSRLPAWFSVDMDLSSNGITWETFEEILQESEPAAERKKTGFLKDLPVRGSLRLSSAFFQYHTFRWEPFYADISFDGETALITAKKAALCGVATTGTVGLTEQGLAIDVTLSAKDREFRPTILCLTNKNSDYTGTFQMEARLKGEGTIDEIAKRLNGTFTLSAKDGKILKSRPLDKTFDLLNESENFKGLLPDLDREIVDYNVIKVLGTIGEHRLQIEEGMIDSPVMGITARGYIDLGDETLDISALVSPLKTVSKVVRKIPVLGYILGGNLVSIPVRISGNMKDPQVTFLSPSAIGSEVLGIAKRTLKLPITLAEPVFLREKGK